MRLKILLPFRIFVEVDDVLRIVVQTTHGSFGIWPHRLDCVAALVPAIFVYEAATAGEVALALDEGILVKTGPEVLVAVRNAVGGVDLGHLREAVEKQFLHLDEREKTVRSALARLECSLVRRFIEINRHE